MIAYNLCLTRQGDKILLLNREKAAWMGRWNGVGGKVMRNESPRESMVRELEEETGITSYELTFKGLVTWSLEGSGYGGMFLYLADIDSEIDYPTPIKTREGILDWKSVEWIVHPDNQGIASNLPYIFRYLFQNERCYIHHGFFASKQLLEVLTEELHPACEDDPSLRERFLQEHRHRMSQMYREQLAARVSRIIESESRQLNA
ncbi:NUDIX domain-containing protein [Paenibacillus senegalensis]|uniref:NUDIX domain-containing protein n=1 Tax=Paenibacillus senegalensis TaxID=1465766 RepID=UPI000287E7ED|nr:NUDIX domain-containing protein [Paenibacillus senegalensis]